MKTVLSKLFYMLIAMAFLIGGKASATTSNEDLDQLLELRKNYTSTVAFLMQVTKEGSVPRTINNMDLLKFLSESQDSRLAINDDYGVSFVASPYKFDMTDLTFCHESSDLTRLCFNDRAKKAILNLTKLYTNKLFRVDYKYTKALSLLSEDSMSATHRAQIASRAEALKNVSKTVQTLKEKLEAANVAVVNSVMLTILAVAFLALCFIVTATATLAGPGLIGLLAFVGMVTSATGAVGMFGYGVSKSFSIEKQLAPLLQQQAHLTEFSLLDKDVMEILNKSLNEKLGTKIQITVP